MAALKESWPLLLCAVWLGLAVLFFVKTMDAMVLVYGLFAAGGIWVYADAPKHGMERAPWTLVSTVLGVVGLLAYLVVRDVRRRPTA